jgi:hypothetical protein
LGVQQLEEMELFVIASKLILVAIKTDPYTFYGSEDFRDYNQNFLENYRKLNPKKDSENILISHLIQNELLYKICRNDKKI